MRINDFCRRKTCQTQVRCTGKFDALEGHLKYAIFNFSLNFYPFYLLLAALLYSSYLRKI